MLVLDWTRVAEGALERGGGGLQSRRSVRESLAIARLLIIKRGILTWHSCYSRVSKILGLSERRLARGRGDRGMGKLFLAPMATRPLAAEDGDSDGWSRSWRDQATQW